MLEHNEPNEAPQTGATDAASGGPDNETAAAPRRRRRAASRPAGPPVDGAETQSDAPAAAPAIPVPPGDPATIASDGLTADIAASGDIAGPGAPSGIASTPFGTAEAIGSPASLEAEAAAPAPRTRRRATRKVAAPATEASGVMAEAAEAEVPSADEVPSAPVEVPDTAEAAAPPRARRRATRKVAAPAAAPEAPGTVDAEPGEAAAQQPADATGAAEPADTAEAAAPPRARRRATRKVAAPAAAPEAEKAEFRPAEAAAPAEAVSDAAPASPRARRTRKRAVPAASFLAEDDGSRRLKPGALAPKDAEDSTDSASSKNDEQPAQAPAEAPAQEPVRASRRAARKAAAVKPVTYIAKAVRDGSGWAVEVEDAFDIRGYGATVEEARAKAVEAVAEAFDVPAGSVVIDVREEPVAEEPQASGRRRAVRPPTALFQPPVFVAPPIEPQAPPVADEPEAEPATAHATEPAAEDFGPRRRRRRRGAPAAESVTVTETAPQQAAAVEAPETAAEAEDESSEEDGYADEAHDGDGDRPSRRRRRGGRRRRRGEEASAGEDEDTETEAFEDDEAAGEAPEHGAEDDDDHGSSSSRRRRRRRRRGGESAEAVEAGADDPERTVVKVREPREARAKTAELGTGFDEVTSIKGSTRMEAKKQRRREGREQGRRRVPIITEAEFLARREAVERVMIVRENGDRTQIGVLEDNVLVEHYVNKEQATSYVGNVYLGKVQNVLPSMEAAFVDIGKGRNAVLYAGEVNFEALGMGHGPRRIETALKSGQPVLVQVTKDPIGHKGARLTSQVSLPGRYLVYVPEGSMTGISRKLPDTERARLKQILKRIVPEDAGVIVRTAAEGASEDELARDVERLQAQWESIQQKAKAGNAPALLYGEPDMTVRVVRDIFNEDFTKVIVSGDTAWETIHGYVSHVAPDLTDRLSMWTSEVDVFATYRIDEQLLKALDRKVWLPSGGSLVIDKTEAMIVVDVNTGKFTGQGGNLEETVTRNNLEAAEEIVRQLRLRDLGGIVVIDFIDMVLESNRDLVMRRLLECLGRDRTKHQVAEVTSLGLVQMTRKRVGQGLLESFSETCVHCNGRGVIVHMDQATTTGGGGKRKRRRGAADDESVPALEAEIDENEAETEADETFEAVEILETQEIPEAAEAPQVEAEEEWFSSPAEAEAAVRGRGRRRASRRVTAPVSSPEAPAEIVIAAPAGPATEPQVAEAAVEVAPEPVPAPEPAAPARTRRRATRKVTAPAGAPKAAEAEVVVVPSAPVAPAAEEAPTAPEPAAEQPVAEPAPARQRRRVTRSATVSTAPDEAAVVVVSTPAADADAEPEPKKRAPRKAAVKKTTAKKTVAKKTTAAAKKTVAKKATAKKASTKKAAAAEQTPGPGVSADASADAS
jgi:ribonuclease E